MKPLSLRTNCTEDARISSSVAGGLKLCRVLMFRHIVFVHQLVWGQRLRLFIQGSLLDHCSSSSLVVFSVTLGTFAISAVLTRFVPKSVTGMPCDAGNALIAPGSVQMSALDYVSL